MWFVYFVLEHSFTGEGRRGQCAGCNSPWTSIILDFSTGWSSMQRGHFLSTKTKTIMMIKKTCSACVGGVAHVGGSGVLQGKHCSCVGWSLGTKSLHWKQARSYCTEKQKQRLLNAAWDCWRSFDMKVPRSSVKVKEKRNPHGFNSTQPYTDAERCLWGEAFQWLIGLQEIRMLQASRGD